MKLPNAAMAGSAGITIPFQSTSQDIVRGPTRPAPVVVRRNIVYMSFSSIYFAFSPIWTKVADGSPPPVNAVWQRLASHPRRLVR
jgi:hypothetical protein